MQTMKKAIELAPRNEHYQFNLANIYMMNRKMDDAIAIFRSLSGTGNPEISARANQALAQAETFQAQFKTYQVQMESRNSESIPETRAAPDSPVSRTEVSAKMAEPVAVRFMKGTLSAIDCSSGPQALFTVTAGARSVKLRVKDRAHMIVIGADEFSCDWKNKSVGVNFRERTDGDADVVSLEVQ